MVNRLKQFFQLDLFRDFFHDAVSPKGGHQPLASLIAQPSVQAETFEDLLRGFTPAIEVEWSGRSLRSWSMRWQKGSVLKLRLPLVMRAAPKPICLAVLHWAVAVTKGNRGHFKTKRRELEFQIQGWLDQADEIVPEQLQRQQQSGKRLLSRLKSRGQYHDLQSVFQSINQQYFKGALQAQITWSARKGGLSTHSQRPNPQGGRFHLISISQGYDAPDVTPEILGGVVYHECLHIVIPPYVRNGRRIVHGPEFRKAEKQYDHYQKWIAWHQTGLPKSLRKLMRQK